MTTPLDDDDVSADLSGQFLKQSDFEDRPSQLFTIQRVEKKTFEAQGGRPAESKWVVTFDNDKCLGLNRTNLQLLAKWFGKKAGTWVGQKVVVYRDESITFGGRLVGGLRVRKPTRVDKKTTQSAAVNAADAVDDVPF
jgi:hypothetical protein